MRSTRSTKNTTRSGAFRSLVLLLSGVFMSFQLQAAILVDEPWENNLMSLLKISKSGSYNPEIVSSPAPVCSKQRSAKFRIQYQDDGNGYRSEYALQGAYRHFRYGNEYWISFSTMLAPNWEPDLTSHPDMVFQFHGVPDEDSAGNLLEPYRNPIMALRVTGSNWTLDSRWDQNAHSVKGNMGSVSHYTLAPINPGQWDNWVMKIKFAHNAHSDGNITVWRNGTEVLNHSGPNAYNDARGPYPKFGLYKAGWKHVTTWGGPSAVDERVVYVDALRIGDSGSSYNEVTEGGCIVQRKPLPPTLILPGGE